MDPKGMRMGSGEGFTMRNFIVCIIRVIKSDGQVMWAEWKKVGVLSKF